MADQPEDWSARAETSGQPVASDRHQFVTCQVGGVTYGFNVANVVEIVRVPATIQNPMAPEACLGLAEIRGSIIPILDLRTLLHYPKADPDGTSRVIVTYTGRPIGFLVDNIVGMLEVAPHRIEPASCIGDLVSVNLVEGLLKDQNGGQTTLFLDAARLIDPEMSKALEQAAEHQGATAEIESDRGAATATEADTRELLTFMLNSEEYAFDIEGIEQITRVPKTITKMPATGDHVLGTIDLRGQVIPLVSLRRMLHRVDSPIGADSRILVATMAIPSGRPGQIGLLVDQVCRILHVASSDLESGPELIYRDGRKHREIITVLPMDNGSGQVSVLDLEGLFHGLGDQEGITAPPGKMTSKAASPNTENQSSTKSVAQTQLVVFSLDGQEHGVLLDLVQEITKVPERIIQVPGLSGSPVGIINLRGTAVPVTDMRAKIQLAAMEKNDSQRILIFDVDGGLHGFIVDVVVEVLRTTTDKSGSVPSFAGPRMVVNLENEGRLIQVLDVRDLLGKSERSPSPDSGPHALVA